jgi:hypothetical protein
LQNIALQKCLPFIKLQGVVEQSDKFNGWIIKQSFIKGEKV